MTLEATPTYTIVVAPVEVDMASSDALREDIERATQETAWVIVDLSAVDFIDSVGLTALMWGKNLADGHGGGLVLVGPRERTLKMLHLTQLDRVFDIYDATQSVPPAGQLQGQGQ